MCVLGGINGKTLLLTVSNPLVCVHLYEELCAQRGEICRQTVV